MLEIPMTPPIFAEERMQAPVTYDYLISIVAGLAAIPHVEVAQDFMRYIEHLVPHEEAAQDRDLVFAFLNDDGKGLNVAANTAVGYRLAKIRQTIETIKKLPYDRIAVDPGYPVDMPERFTRDFARANTPLPVRQEKTNNFLQDLIVDLGYVSAVLDALAVGFDTKIEATAKTVYSKKTLAIYRVHVGAIYQETKAIKKQNKAAAKIISKYLNQNGGVDAEELFMRQQLALEEETRQIAVRLKSGEDVDV